MYLNVDTYVWQTDGMSVPIIRSAGLIVCDTNTQIYNAHISV